jgi:hypothetical protein
MAGQRLRAAGPPLCRGCAEVVTYLSHRTILLAAFDVILANSNVAPSTATRSSSTNNTKRRRRGGGPHIRLAVTDYTAHKYPEVKNKDTGATTRPHR